MAKRKDDDDFGAEDFGDDPPAASGQVQSPSGGLLARIPAPITGIAGKIRDFFESIRLAVGSAWTDPQRPWMPLAMLGGIILVLLMLVIIMFVVLGGALSGDKTAALKSEPPVVHEAPMDGNSEPKSTIEGPGSRIQGDLGLRDSFLGNPILPDEPGFMLQGEIHYQREPKPFWGQADIGPGWQNLETLYRQMLREKNRDDFYRLMGETPPKKDGY